MSISNYEKQYMQILSDIYSHGYDDGVNERTKYRTKRLPGRVIQVDLEKEFPILKSKKMFWKTALKEILWIWQCQSNNIKDLGAHIWDAWADGNGSIGTAYGAQVRKPVCIYTDPVNKTPESFRAYENQTKYVLEYLREFPNGRWANATLWNVNDLATMNLVPCCHTATWNLDGGRLNCVLDQRSGDSPVGVPFNTTQYAMLTILFARDLGVKPGLLTHVIADAHIYANQMQGVEQQLAYYELLSAVEEHPNAQSVHYAKAWVASSISGDSVSTEELLEHAHIAIDCIPKFVVTGSTNFFDVTVNECNLENYCEMGKIDFGEVAV